MKVYYIKPPITGEPTYPRILMQPEDDHDREVLEKIYEHAVDMGRDAITGELLHVEILSTT